MNPSSTLTCCNCQLAEGEKAHPSNYQGCRHAKGEISKDTENYNWKDVLLKLYHPNFVLHSGASRQLRAKEATTSMPEKL
jgi:hypothetical protein